MDLAGQLTSTIAERKLKQEEDAQQEEEQASALFKKALQGDTTSQEDTTVQSENLLNKPLNVENTEALFRGLFSTADEALMREGRKPGIDIFLDTMMLVPRGVKALAEGVVEQAKEFYEDPKTMIPAAGSVLLGTAGAITGNPALAIGGAYAGRTLGRYMLAQLEGRHFGTIGDAIDIGLGGASSSFTMPVGGAIRAGLRKAGVVTGKGVGMELVKNIVERPPVLDPHTAIAKTVASDLQAATLNAQALRDMKYAEAKTLKLQQQFGARSWKDVLLDPTVSTRDKVRLVDEVKSLEEDRRFALSMRTHKGHDTRWGTPPELKKVELTAEEKTKPLQEVLAERNALRNALLKQPGRAKPLTEETVSGTKRRFVEFAESEEGRRIGSGQWEKHIDEYAHESMEALRMVVGLTPEVLKNPLLQRLQGRFSQFLAPMLFDTQVGFRKNGNSLLTHMGDVVLHASEAVRTLTYNSRTRASEVIARHGLTKEEVLHLSSLQSKGAIVQAYDVAKRELQKVKEKELAGFKPAKGAGLNVDYELQKNVMAAAKRYGYNITDEDMPSLMKSLRFLDDWRTEVMDPLFGVAHTFNRDPRWLPLMSPTYFLPTSAHRRDLVELQFQKQYVQDMMGKVDVTTAVGRVQAKRYQDVMDSLLRKEKIAQRAADRLDVTITNMHKMIEEKGVKYTLKNMDSFLPTKAHQLATSFDVEGSAHQYIDGFVKKVVYDQALPAAYNTLETFVKANVKDRPYATTRAASWAHNVLLDQLSSRKNAKLQNIQRAFDNPYWHGAAHRVGQMINFISEAHYVLNVAMKPRFYGLQMLQNVLALAPQVDTESLAHGIYRTLFDRKAAWEEARRAGVLTEGVHNVDQMSMLKEEIFTGEHVAGMVGKVLKGMGKLADLSEQANRVLSFHAGIHHAELNGLTGASARRKAQDIVKDAHFLYDPANRPVITNTPAGSLMFRYRTFSQNYASFLAQRLREGDPSRVAASFGALLATSGTSGIPLYSMVRNELGKLGYNAPELHPLDEMLGIDIGGTESPIPSFPSTPNEVLGPFWQQAQQVYDAATTEAPLKARIGAAIGSLSGSVIQQLVGAGQETALGGVVTSRGQREVRSVRGEREVALSALGLRPSARALQSEAYRRLGGALKTGNSDFLSSEIEKLQKKGVTNVRQTLRRLQTAQRSGENLSAIEILSRSPSR